MSNTQQQTIFVHIATTLIMYMGVNLIATIYIAMQAIIIKILKEKELMISKETFVKTMTRLEALDNKMDNVDVAMKALSSDFCGFYIPEILDITMTMLEDIFKDTHRWLSYFIFELDWLHNYEENDVLVNDMPVDVSTWDKVYEFLIWNMHMEE
jgi:hypothetical protein